MSLEVNGQWGLLLPPCPLITAIRQPGTSFTCPFLVKDCPTVISSGSDHWYQWLCSMLWCPDQYQVEKTFWPLPHWDHWGYACWFQVFLVIWFGLTRTLICHFSWVRVGQRESLECWRSEGVGVEGGRRMGGRNGAWRRWEETGREGMSEVLSAYKSISRVTHIANRNNTYCLWQWGNRRVPLCQLWIYVWDIHM